MESLMKTGCESWLLLYMQKLPFKKIGWVFKKEILIPWSILTDPKKIRKLIKFSWYHVRIRIDQFSQKNENHWTIV
jgi:hypothetical protein